ncbi:MAG: 2-succinyl-5-enolpyruvyl-6-hydroxy-3-cyclohexene-1-carboxylic-acid synthase [Acidimicrobiales bacterium]
MSTPDSSPSPTALPETANATFCATLVDTWVARGVDAAFIAPGSRSTPLALALAARDELAVHVFHDERSASFAALGHARATGNPSVILCSSGTAGTHFHGAVVEADLSRVPLLVCTADRPPELWDRGAPQTIRQTHLYGGIVRSFVEPGCPDDTDPATWRALAHHSVDAALGHAGDVAAPGPVHANLSFRDPLTGVPGVLPDDTDRAVTRADAPAVSAGELDELAALLSVERGVIVVGRTPTDPAAILELAERLGWPVIADHRSGCRTAATLRHADTILRHRPFVEGHRPDAVLRLGEIVSSKSVSQFVSGAAAAGATVVAACPWDRLIDPEHSATHTPPEAGLVAGLLERLPATANDATWLDAWRRADAAAVDAIDAVLAGRSSATEPAVARLAVDATPSGGALVASSSMPTRDVEWFGANRDDIAVFANRGANGIDGIVATAVGTALAGLPTICLIGDVAFLHDATSLTALGARTESAAIDLTIVAVDNDGGGIFSFLPQHQLLPAGRYEQLFGTPHGTDLTALVAAHGLTVHDAGTTLPAADEITPDGIRVVRVATDRADNLALHDELVAAVAAAL